MAATVYPQGVSKGHTWGAKALMTSCSSKQGARCPLTSRRIAWRLYKGCLKSGDGLQILP